MGWILTDLGGNGGSSGATLTMTGLTIPANSLIIVGTGETTDTIGGSIADSASNSYSVAVNDNSTGNKMANIFYCITANEVTSITYTREGSGHDAVMAALYAAGYLTFGPLDNNGCGSAGANSHGISVTSGSSTQAGDLFVSFGYWGGSATFTQDTADGWGSSFGLDNESAGSERGQGATLIKSGIGAVTWAPTISSSNTDWVGLIAAFKTAPIVGFARRKLVYCRR